jgi:hypothetical protein
MPPIDYSKWDNIDTDSDSGSRIAPSGPKTSCETYTLDFARRNHEHNHKPLFPTRLIQQHSQGRARAMRRRS